MLKEDVLAIRLDDSPDFQERASDISDRAKRKSCYNKIEAVIIKREPAACIKLNLLDGHVRFINPFCDTVSERPFRVNGRKRRNLPGIMSQVETCAESDFKHAPANWRERFTTLPLD